MGVPRTKYFQMGSMAKCTLIWGSLTWKCLRITALATTLACHSYLYFYIYSGFANTITTEGGKWRGQIYIQQVKGLALQLDVLCVQVYDFSLSGYDEKCCTVKILYNYAVINMTITGDYVVACDYCIIEHL